MKKNPFFLEEPFLLDICHHGNINFRFKCPINFIFKWSDLILWREL